MAKKPGASKSNPQRTKTAERDAQIWELRKAGCTFRQIAEKLDCAVRTAYAGWQRTFKRILPPEEEVEKERALELARLDDIWLTLWSQYTKDARENKRPDLAIIDRMLKMMKQRARFIPGLEVPQQVDAYIETRSEVSVQSEHRVTIEQLVQASNERPELADNIVDLVRRIDELGGPPGGGDAEPGVLRDVGDEESAAG